MMQRAPENPILTPADLAPSHPSLRVCGTFNAGATAMGDEIILLVRVFEQALQPDADWLVYPHMTVDNGHAELRFDRIRRDDPTADLSDPRLFSQHGRVRLTGISHLRVARSTDGVRFTFDDQPLLAPETREELFGCEDARVTPLDGWFYINYTAVSDLGIATALARTRDFRTVERLGIIFPPANRDVTILPEKVGGRYWCYHRPMPREVGEPTIWSAHSADLLAWGGHRFLTGTSNSGWDSAKVGGGAVPIKTDAGWLSLYHGADKANRYCLGAMLTDLDDPARLVGRAPRPVLVPETPYETAGFFGPVVFTCGAVVRGDNVLVYYGASDQTMAVATVPLADLVAACGE